MSEIRITEVLWEKALPDGAKPRTLGGAVRGKVDSIRETVTETVQVEALVQNISSYVAMVEQLAYPPKKPEGKVGRVELDEIELSLQVTAKGEVSLLGNGVETGGTDGLKLKFKRQG